MVFASGMRLSVIYPLPVPGPDFRLTQKGTFTHIKICKQGGPRVAPQNVPENMDTATVGNTVAEWVVGWLDRGNVFWSVLVI